MARRAMSDVLNDCIDRLAAGQTVADCLRAYPEYAAELEALLEAGRLAHRAQSSEAEVAAAQAEQRRRFERALRASTPVHREFPLQRALGLVASFALIFALLLSGATLAAQNSLPGDALYPFKLFSENVRLELTGNDTALAAQFRQRRIDETRQLLALQRETEVAFEGVVESNSDSDAVISGLTVLLTDDTSGRENLLPRAQVAVRATTTADGELVAREIRLLTAPPQEAPTSTLSPTPPPTRVTQRPISPTPAIRPAATETPQPTIVESCQISPPRGWTAYIVQEGDTLSGLVARTRAILAEVMRVNCMADGGHLRVGQVIYLPRSPARQPTPEASRTADAEQQRDTNPSRPNNPTATPIPTRNGRGG